MAALQHFQGSRGVRGILGTGAGDVGKHHVTTL
jgi:hypothetical protein